MPGVVKFLERKDGHLLPTRQMRLNRNADIGILYLLVIGNRKAQIYQQANSFLACE